MKYPFLMVSTISKSLRFYNKYKCYVLKFWIRTMTFEISWNSTKLSKWETVNDIFLGK